MGFFSNIGVDSYISVRKKLSEEFNTLENFSGSIIKSNIPNGEVEISEDNILRIYSKTFPDISYEFDITDAVDYLVSESIRLSAFTPFKEKGFNWDYVGFGNNTIYLRSVYVIIKLDKQHVNVIIKTNPVTSAYSPNALYPYDKELAKYFQNLSGKGDIYEYSFKKKEFKYSCDLKDSSSSPVRVCADMRNYIAKALDGLSRGKISPITVKRDLQEYINKLG